GGAVLTGATLLGRHLILNSRGKPAEEVYRRPFSTVHAALAEGKPFSKAVEMGRNRLWSLVSTDMQMAKVRQADASLRRSGAKYY
ncbi:hypothetical protein, partial [Nocardia farcinica]|uniref:hypothetical protein n=1 Tax=Nocardia farcinica TaxID=37329 RepID=UPI001C0F058D